MKSGKTPALSMPPNMIAASSVGGPWKYSAANGASIAAKENTTVAGLRPIRSESAGTRNANGPAIPATLMTQLISVVE